MITNSGWLVLSSDLDTYGVGATAHTMDDVTLALARDAGMFEENVVRAAADVVRVGRIREMLLP